MKREYGIRYNLTHKPYILVSCTNGHPIESINLGTKFGGSAAEARLAFQTHKCADCEGRYEQTAVSA